MYVRQCRRWLIIVKCKHLDCANSEKIWLPYTIRELSFGLHSHPFCIHCGMVRNITSERSKSIGYFINVISNIDKHIKTSGASVRMRLAVKELQQIEDFEDNYSMSKYAQEIIFINIIMKYYKIPERTVRQFL